MLVLLLLSSTIFSVFAKDDGSNWPRWEKRTLVCSNGTQGLACHLTAPNSLVIDDPSTFKCHQEPLPHVEWNTLPTSETRLSCPIGCSAEADLSVLQKTPHNNKHCVKYFTYGKYRDHQAKEWYLWIAAPCSPQSITTFCRFKDALEKEFSRSRSRRHQQKLI